MKVFHYKAEQLTDKNGKTFKKGQIIEEGKRIARCMGFIKDENGQIYAHYQYILRATFKPSGKSTSFGKPINI
jgi:hypothetical protein